MFKISLNLNITETGQVVFSFQNQSTCRIKERQTHLIEMIEKLLNIPDCVRIKLFFYRFPNEIKD